MMSSVSIIIPTRRLDRHIQPCIDSCRRSLPGAEIIIVVASADPVVAASADVPGVVEGMSRVVYARRGRGPQCNAGARVARGELFLFLHDDCTLPECTERLLESSFERTDAELACFRLRFDEAHWLLGAYAWFSRFDSILTSFGDQGILIRRRHFDLLGGFPDWPLFEDVELLRRARRLSRIRKLPGAVTTSAVRFLRNGILLQQLMNGRLILLYLLGVPPSRLAESYERVRK
jgi:rSAM/selenodomain-associated transferase 2